MNMNPSLTSTTFNQSIAYEALEYGLFPNISFRSNSSLLAPRMNFMRWASQCESDEFLFFNIAVKRGNNSLIIADQKGDLVWGLNRHGNRVNLHVVKYKGDEYLAYWEGHSVDSPGNPSYHMLNRQYEEIYHIIAGRNLSVGGNRHDFSITPFDTALFPVYEIIPWNLTRFGIKDGWIQDGVIQEVDVETNELLWEWKASEHFSFDDMSEVAWRARKDTGKMDKALDIFHLNSIVKDARGNILISMRFNEAATYINGSTGEIIWQLGGVNNTFSVSPDEKGGENGTFQFGWNHDARFCNGDDENLNSHLRCVTLFDNRGWDYSEGSASRGVKIRLDTSAMIAHLETEYHAPNNIHSPSQGSHQILENGHSFIGWGHTPAFSEFTENGKLLCDVHFAPVLISSHGTKWKHSDHVQSYRVWKQRWSGLPSAAPDILIEQGMLWVSWNGATEVKSWRLESASEQKEAMSWSLIDTVTKRTFETSINLTGQVHEAEIYKITPLDRNDASLGSLMLDKKGKLVSWEPENRQLPSSHIHTDVRGLSMAASTLRHVESPPGLIVLLLAIVCCLLSVRTLRCVRRGRFKMTLF